MIFTKETAHQKIAELLEIQNGLYIKIENESQIELAGDIFVNCKSKGFFLSENYPVQIVIPINSKKLPYVIDNGSRIAKDYPHRYENGELCLETETRIRVRFIDSFSLSEWMQEFVEPYYFSYEFFQRYGEFPFGERSHGIQGILETYQELFQEKDAVRVFAIMKAIYEHPYRGHLLCPCGSNKRLRLCHGPRVMKYYTDDRLKKIVQTDYKNIINYLDLANYYELLQHKKRQNESFMLKIQYAARYCYNMAEKQNYFAWLLCLISALCIFFPDGLPMCISLGVPFVADIFAWVLMGFVNKNVQRAADLRKYFDAYSIGINAIRHSDEEKRRLTELAEVIYTKNSRVAEIQMKNTGTDSPPGVQDWYVFSDQYNGLEAKFECQRQNTWWNEKLFRVRCIVTHVFLGIIVVIFFVLAILNGFCKALLCSAGLFIWIAERVKCNWKYCVLSFEIKGAQQILEVNLTTKGIERLQEFIDDRRTVNIVGINMFYKKNARGLSHIYKNISNPK